MSTKNGFSIPINTIGPGLSLPHYGTIIVSENARIGENCRIHAGTNIGSTNGQDKAKVIGNNVYIGPGAKLIGEGYIADNVVIGANAVVIGNVEEEGITVGGIPAKKISENDSSTHLIKATEIVGKSYRK
ncbi:serine O-acetyltransferase [Clostridiales bacterium FE2010]|nr:serine O-acetyltransferase [Clostridiales bacterium FE2010]